MRIKQIFGLGCSKLLRLYPYRCLTNPARTIVYCPIPKVACTSLKLLFLKSQGATQLQGQLKEAFGKAEFHQEIHDHFSIDRLNLKERIQLHKNAYSFAVVRNPWDRIVSTYLDKFVRSKKPEPFVFQMLKRSKSAQSLDELTFKGFLRVLVDTTPQLLNSHLVPQKSILGNSAYNEIIQLEAPDLNEQVKKILHTDIDLEVSNATRNHPQKGNYIGNLPLSQIRAGKCFLHYSCYYDSEDLRLFSQLYQDDIQLGNYNFNAY